MSDKKKIYRVFISSTYRDNVKRRKIVSDAIARAGMFADGMEHFAASTRPTVETCKRLARECDVYLGLIAHRYGWIPRCDEGGDGESSITELEYHAACERPRLVLKIDPGQLYNDEDLDDGPDRFLKRQKLEKFLNGLSQHPGVFRDEDLSGVVMQALLQWKEEHEGKMPVAPSLAVETRGPKGAKRVISNHELTGIELVAIPAGTFKMGSPPDQGEENEHPQHNVTLSGFELGKYPVTREQYRRFLKANRKVKPPPFWDDRRFNLDRQPVVGVTWNAAQAYAEWAGLRLPTEAEWEYACRAGSEANYCSGDKKEHLREVGWYDGNSGGRLHEVGEKSPNAYGLYDLHGNVWEWCSDLYHSSYDRWDATDPVGPERGDDRVLRGGTWYDPAHLARSAYRLFHHPASVISSVGFRLARGPRTDR